MDDSAQQIKHSGAGEGGMGYSLNIVHLSTVWYFGAWLSSCQGTGRQFQAVEAVWGKRWDKTALALGKIAGMTESTVELGKARNWTAQRMQLEAVVNILQRPSTGRWHLPALLLHPQQLAPVGHGVLDRNYEGGWRPERKSSPPDGYVLLSQGLCEINSR